MKELRDIVIAFNNERDWDQFHSPKNLAMALMVEMAELLEHFQWISEEQSRNLSSSKKEHISEEIGDVLIYLVNLADKLGIDPIQAAKNKIKQNHKKYPAATSRGKSLKYDEYE
ncbi:MAG: nucleotide pyrophosphohydrolase [Desulfobulbaceae bacterium]|uniref:Nucleotide pyrophosphohydrolase n=1 Tax=Candidatus Desulfobia pelagia TaxID=2841692 RepID=A0A8J6TGA1_9BACT|nr:nucleotide pyrophosphohydrolase [Candidatus Desulfobia pelagia]